MGDCKCDCKDMDMPHMMLKLGDDAWADLMKEKMKAVYERERGANMDKASEVIVHASIDFWMQKMAGKEVGDEFFAEFGKKLDAAFQG